MYNTVYQILRTGLYLENLQDNTPHDPSLGQTVAGEVGIVLFHLFCLQSILNKIIRILAGVTGQQGALLPPHQIIKIVAGVTGLQGALFPPLECPGICVCPFLIHVLFIVIMISTTHRYLHFPSNREQWKNE
jgi:hypothetical protein